MTDTAISLALPIVRAVVDRTKERYVVERNVDQYNENDIKQKVYDALKQIREDTKVLRNVDFRTARDKLVSWQQSDQPITCETNKDRLRVVSDRAASAVHAVPDPIDKLMAAYFVIVADYHLVALSSSTSSHNDNDNNKTSSSSSSSQPDWLAGKREAQKLLRQYVDLLQPQLSSAAREEIEPSIRSRVFRNKDKRRMLLQSYVSLSHTVYELYPQSANDGHGIGGGSGHPQYEQLQRGAMKMISSSSSSSQQQQRGLYEYLSPKIGHLLQHPILASTFKGGAGGGGAAVMCCTVFANDSRVLCGSSLNKDNNDDNESLKIWDLTNGRQVDTLGQLRTHHQSVTCCGVYYANDDDDDESTTRFVSGGDDSLLRVWNVTTDKKVPLSSLHMSIRGHVDTVTCCTVFANDTRVVSGSGDKTLKVWNLSSGKELCTLSGHRNWVSCCAVYANDTKVISGGYDCVLKVWDLTNAGRNILNLVGHAEPINCCAVYANDTRAISGGWDKTLQVWDLSTGKELYALEGHTGSVHCCAVFGKNDSRLVSGSYDTTLKIWDLENGNELYTLQGHTDTVRCCAVFANGTRVISGGDDTSLKVWLLPSSLSNG